MRPWSSDPQSGHTRTHTKCMSKKTPHIPGTQQSVRRNRYITHSIEQYTYIFFVIYIRKNYISNFRSASMSFKYLPTSFAISLVFGFKMSFTVGNSRSMSWYSVLMFCSVLTLEYTQTLRQTETEETLGLVGTSV